MMSQRITCCSVPNEMLKKCLLNLYFIKRTTWFCRRGTGARGKSDSFDLRLSPKEILLKRVGQQQNEGDLDWCWAEEAFTLMPTWRAKSQPAQESVDVALWHMCDVFSQSYSVGCHQREDKQSGESKDTKMTTCSMTLFPSLFELISLKLTSVCYAAGEVMGCLTTCSRCEALSDKNRSPRSTKVMKHAVGLWYLVLILHCNLQG